MATRVTLIIGLAVTLAILAFTLSFYISSTASYSVSDRSLWKSSSFGPFTDERFTQDVVKKAFHYLFLDLFTFSLDR